MLHTDYKFGEINRLVKQVSAVNENVSFKRIFENENGGVSVLAFKEGQKLERHTSPAEVMVYVAEGEIEFTMAEKPHIIKAGEFLLMGADVPHSVSAVKDSKVVLIKIKP